jgi:uncharacterized membrane protein
MTDYLPYIISWAVLATIVACLAFYRRKIRTKSDEILHVLDAEASQVSTQEIVAKKLSKVDFWGKTLTVLVVLYGLAIVGMYFYRLFTDTSIKMN